MKIRSVPLDELQKENGAFVDGPFGSNLKASEYVDTGVPIMRIQNVKANQYISKDIKYITSEKAEELSRHAYSSGDVVIAKLGDCGTACVVPPGSENGIIVADVVRFRGITSKINHEYLCYFLNSSQGQGQVAKLSKGTTRRRINLSDLKKIQIPLPPLPEQKRIATILDKADAIRRKRQAAITLADDFLRATFLDMFGDISAKKSNYSFRKVRPFCIASSGKSGKFVSSPNKTKYPIYGGNGINGWATEPLYEEPVIVVGRVGQQCGIVHVTMGPSWVTDNAIVIKIKKKDMLNQIYLAHAIQNSPIRATVERLDLPFINQSMILDFPFPLPPVNEQNKYAKLTEKIYTAQNNHLKLLNESNILFNSLTQRAFRGDL